MTRLMNKNVCCVLTICIAVMVSGCAGYNITKDGMGKGYDVYKPEPYLMINPGEEGPKGEIVWLPNYKERYRIDTWNFLGKADFQFDISDGWKLTKISDKGDNTAIASKLMDIIQKSTKPETISLTGDFHLFRLIYKDGIVAGMKQIQVEEVDQK